MLLHRKLYHGCDKTRNVLKNNLERFFHVRHTFNNYRSASNTNYHPAPRKGVSDRTKSAPSLRSCTLKWIAQWAMKSVLVGLINTIEEALTLSGALAIKEVGKRAASSVRECRGWMD